MRYAIVRAHFASTHMDEDEGPHLHGHTFFVEAHEQATDAGVKLGAIQYDLEQTLNALDIHNLDEMLVGGSQTLDGIGSWVMEQLVMRHPRLTDVIVWTADQPDRRAGVRREIR